MSKWPLVALVPSLMAAGFSGCSGDRDGTRDGSWQGEGPAAWRGMQPHLDLLEHVHLADVQAGGLVMDFGTPARQKYTAGGFKTSWDGDTEQNGMTFTYATSNTCRVYFPVDEVGALTIRFRMRPHGSRTMSVYLNNEPISAVRMQDEGFKEYELAVPAERVREGENYLLLRFNGTTSVGQYQAAAAVDWIYVVPAGGEAGAPTLYGELRGEMEVGGERRRVVAMHPGMSLSYYVEIPEHAKLGFGLALEGQGEPADVKVVVTPQGGGAKRVFERRVQPGAGQRAAWRDEQVDLAEFAGKLVRLDLETRGTGGDRQRIGWSTPAILVARVAPRERPEPAKNVILILIDTLRADHTTPYAKTRVRTPAFDRFASEGVLFEHAQAPEAWTKPSCASVLSGLYPDTHQTNTFDARLPESVTMLSEVFRDQGLRTATIIANGYVSDKFGFNQGWEHYANYIREKRPTEAEHVFGSALEWIREHKSERFFLYLQTIDPHVPYDPPEEFLRMYDARPYDGEVRPRRTAKIVERVRRHRLELETRDRERLEALYDGEISYHDRYFAVLLDKLREWDLLDDTLIVVTSDHGEEFFDHRSVGHGHTLYQEILHVPLVMRYPAALEAGQRVSAPVSIVGIAPTVLEIAGVEVPEEMEGQSLMRPVRGEPPICPEVAFSYFLEDRRAIRTLRWKMVYRGSSTDLFDLENDPRERTDVWEERPIALRYTRTLLGQFLGAPEKRRWCAPASEDEPVRRHEPERIEMDAETRDQLQALGYAN